MGQEKLPESSPQKLITISIPVLNEEGNIERLLAELGEFAQSEKSYEFEFLFTDNASDDKTFELLCEAAQKDNRIRVLRFSRNFGFQKSILTNYLNARGSAVIQIDADLQDPPEMMSEFLRKWEEGYKVVYGIRRKRQESFFLHQSRKSYYRLVSWLSEVELARNSGDFRLIDRRVVEELRTIDEQTPYLRGLIAQLGFSQTGVVYDRSKRKVGSSKFNLFGLIALGIDGITAQSIKPLRLITMLGCIIAATSITIAIYYFIAFLVYGSDFKGFTTLVILSLISFGMNTFFIGLIGEYVGRIFNNTRGLPQTIIEHRIQATDDANYTIKTETN